MKEVPSCFTNKIVLDNLWQQMLYNDQALHKTYMYCADLKV